MKLIEIAKSIQAGWNMKAVKLSVPDLTPAIAEAEQMEKIVKLVAKQECQPYSDKDPLYGCNKCPPCRARALMAVTRIEKLGKS